MRLKHVVSGNSIRPKYSAKVPYRYRNTLPLCHLFDPIFAHHDHTQGAHGGQRPVQRVDEIVVQVKEYQVRQVR